MTSPQTFDQELRNAIAAACLIGATIMTGETAEKEIAYVRISNLPDAPQGRLAPARALDVLKGCSPVRLDRDPSGAWRVTLLGLVFFQGSPLPPCAVGIAQTREEAFEKALAVARKAAPNNAGAGATVAWIDSRRSARGLPRLTRTEFMDECRKAGRGSLIAQLAHSDPSHGSKVSGYSDEDIAMLLWQIHQTAASAAIAG